MTSRINRSSWTSSGSRGSPAPAPGHKPQRHKSNTPSPTRLLLTRQDLDQLGGSLFAERDWSHRDNVDGRRRLQSCPTDRGHSPPLPPPSPTGVTDSPLISEAGAGTPPFTEPFSCVSGIFSVCEITKKHLLASLGRGAARLCVSHLRRLFARRLLISHFPPTCCRKSEATSLIHLARISPLIRNSVPFLATARVRVLVKERENGCVSA